MKKVRLTGIKVDVHKNQDKILRKQIMSILHIKPEELVDYQLVKRSLDARKKDKVVFIYTLDIQIKGNARKLVERLQNRNVTLAEPEVYHAPKSGEEHLSYPPVVVGAGPAGLFAALLLAEKGYRPILLERGRDVEQRTADVEAFWQTGKLDPESNVQFGEGGAGAFSDGKLTTLIKNIRCHQVLEMLVAFGAPEDIRYSHQPHVGTDVLKQVVKRIREKIIALGGQVRFEAKVTELLMTGGHLSGVIINDCERLYAQAVILAVGHSARDTFEKLVEQGIEVVPKAFAVGVRVEHPQQMISESQYGKFAEFLPPADYKLTHLAKNGRHVYTFCMCPGGEVVAAASETGGVVTNGMSYHAREGQNANSAVVVGVDPSDFGSIDPLAGVQFQRHWERLAYEIGGGDYHAPCQLLGDFLHDRPSEKVGTIASTYQPQAHLAQLKECLPDYVVEALKEALPAFGHKIKGFNHPEAVLTGVETRTSSPIRILRNNQCQAVNLQGLYPCGEGAGYAGGIISAAVDGLRVAEEIIMQYAPLQAEGDR